LENNLQMNQHRPRSDEERVRDFQKKLYRKAKQEKSFRFYVLYDKIRIPYFLREAYRRCRKKNGSAGVDGVTFQDIEDGEGIYSFLKEIETELKERTYKPQPVLRTYIEKANGKLRPLGIPTIKDRVTQMACKLVIEPIFEADFEDESYGFRPKRSAKDAVTKIKENLKAGKTEVLDADLSSYFDTIPHKELMILLGKRISDRNVLHLIKMWLKTPIMEDGKISGGKNNKKGTPQGGVISPLLANIYLNTLDRAVNREGGLFQRNGATIVRYADDFVIMARTITANLEWYLTGLLDRLKLQLNIEKTKKAVCGATQNSFEFLGFSFSHDRDLHGANRKYWNVQPSDKSLKKIKEKLRNYLKSHGHSPPQILVKELNAKLRGWLNYFEIPRVSYPAVKKRKLRWYLAQRIYRFYKRKSQRKCKLHNQGTLEKSVQKYGLIDPSKYFLKGNCEYLR